MPKPLDVVRCLQLVENLLRPGTPERALDRNRSQIQVQGTVHTPSLQGLEILAALGWTPYQRRRVVSARPRVCTVVHRLRQRLEPDLSRPRVVTNLGQGYFLGLPLRMEDRCDPTPG